MNLAIESHEKPRYYKRLSFYWIGYARLSDFAFTIIR